MNRYINEFFPQRVNSFFKTGFLLLKIACVAVMLSISATLNANDLYKTSTDLNLRSGPSTTYIPIAVIKKEDTVTILTDLNAVWAKIDYKGMVGYSSKKFLIKILPVQKEYIDNKVEVSNSLFSYPFILVAFFMIILFLVFEKRKRKKQNQSLRNHRDYSKGNIVHERINKQSEIKHIDSSIIDVTTESLELSVEKEESKTCNGIEVPFWNHMYVYYYDDLDYASQDQRDFYFYFQDCFMNGKSLDIKGNTNYAFILYFDLLNEHEKHKDIELLDSQFKQLGQICPSTKRYALSSLTQLLKEKDDSSSLSRLDNLLEPSYQYEYGYSDYDPDAYKLGKLYSKKLGLNKNEIVLLNKFWNPSNVFLSIEGCRIATIKQYLLVIKELDVRLKNTKSSVEEEVAYFKKQVKKKYKTGNNSEWGYYDISYMINQSESDIYLTIFKRVENSVRKVYRHKRKISGEFSTKIDSRTQEFENRLGLLANEIIEQLKNKIEQPDISNQIELNAQNVSRWKIEFSELKQTLGSNKIKDFVNGISLLEKANQKNPNIENIFFEASKFIAKYDNILSLQYYAKYIYYDLKSNRIDDKQLTKTIQKSLFKNEAQLSDFRRITADLIQDSDIKKALHEISNIYIQKRKKIILNQAEIEDVKQKYSGTVELLNGYLDSEKLETPVYITHEKIENEEVVISIKSNGNSNSIFVPELNLNTVQEQIILNAAKNSFTILKEYVDNIAIDNGMFKNQLIDSINEACFDLLEGEVLIEEEDENFMIEESYYNEILK